MDRWEIYRKLIEPIYWNVESKHLTIQKQVIRSQIHEWCTSPFGTLYLWGNVGAGKTYAAYTIYRSFIDANNAQYSLNFRKTTASDIIFLGEEKGQSALNTFAEDHLLFIDDLGVEKPADWHIKHIFYIFDKRYSYNRPTIVTSNLDPSDLQKMYGERIISRMNLFPIHFDGEDLRKLFSSKPNEKT